MLVGIQLGMEGRKEGKVSIMLVCAAAVRESDGPGLSQICRHEKLLLQQCVLTIDWNWLAGAGGAAIRNDGEAVAAMSGHSALLYLSPAEAAAALPPRGLQLGEWSHPCPRPRQPLGVCWRGMGTDNTRRSMQRRACTELRKFCLITTQIIRQHSMTSCTWLSAFAFGFELAGLGPDQNPYPAGGGGEGGSGGSLRGTGSAKDGRRNGSESSVGAGPGKTSKGGKGGKGEAEKRQDKVGAATIDAGKEFGGGQKRKRGS
jgi:hypothetical protein